MDLPSHQLSMTVLMTPDTANFSSKVHGGTILKLLEDLSDNEIDSRIPAIHARRARRGDNDADPS